MYSIDSNLSAVAYRLLNSLKKVENNASLHLLEAATDGMVAVARRIQQQGRNTAGALMRTKSPQAAGAYSRIHAEYRRAKGRQTDIVDFTLEGDLMRNYNIISSSKREVVVGFLDKDMAKIAGYLEAYFGGAWYLSQGEERMVGNKLVQKTLADFV